MKRRERIFLRVFFVLVFVPMFGVFPYLSAINNPNENVRIYMTMALVDDGTLCIDQAVSRFGWVNDMARVPAPDGTSHYYSVKGPAISFAGVPAYWLFAKIAPRLGHPSPTAPTMTPDQRAWWLRSSIWAARIFAVQLPAFLFLIFLERYLRAFSSDLVFRLTAVVAAGLGTNYLAYTQMYASHALFAVAAFASFAITERELRLSRGDAKRRRASMAFLAGWFAGWSVLLEYHALPVALVLSLFSAVVFYRPTRLLSFTAGGLFHAAVMMFFQWRAYGNPLTPGHKMVENPKFAAEHHQGLFGILMPSWENVVNLSASPAYGFFGTSPYMWLGLLVVPIGLFFAFGLRRGAWRFRAVTATWLLAMAGLWAVNAGAIEWRAGWTIGPRYLGAAPPFFALGAVIALEWLARRGHGARNVSRGVAGGLALASVLSIGSVGIVYDTLPEIVTRPFVQFVLPLARTGFVPHHVLEWFGVDEAWPWYIAAGCLLGAALLAALAPLREKWTAYVARALVFALALGFGLTPAFSTPPPEEPSITDLRWFTSIWEPRDRDFIAKDRVEAERYGKRRPCLWYRIGKLERVLHMTPEAERDEQRAGAPPDRCPLLWY